MTALENVALPLELANKSDVFERAEKELEAVGLGARGDHYPSQMSGGEQQRVALARAVVGRPALLLADEPTGNLDAATGELVMDLLFDLRDQYGATLILVTHSGGRAMMLAWRIARRELRGGVRGFWVFLACLTLGVAAIAAIGTVRGAIEAGLTEQGAVILGGDAEIQLTYRFAKPEERDFFESLGDVSELVDFRSMLAVGEDRALTQIKAVDELYPLYGEVKLSPQMSVQDALAGRGDVPGAAIDPVLLARLGVEVGELVTLGTKDFVVMASLERTPDSAGAGFSLGPPTLVANSDIQDAGLLTPGSLFETVYRIKSSNTLNLDVAKASAEDVLEGTGFRWRDRRNGAPGISRFVERLSAFLVLVGLTGLAVGGVGVSAAVRAYLAGKNRSDCNATQSGCIRRTGFQNLSDAGRCTGGFGYQYGADLGRGTAYAVWPID
ncbi:Lipoprotein-releasing system ATP-binding protein LolD [Nymphon striatum]|nr:Lipoprotein-releasing system ATP-binding protein LolD [Nymphon striatum]